MDSTHHPQPAAPARPHHRRPRQPVKRPRTIRFALTDEEFSEVGAAADRAGLAKGAFAAQATLAIARSGTTPSESPLRESLGEFIRAAGLVRRIGVNLNQAVAKLNATGQRSGDFVEVLSGLSAGERVVAPVPTGLRDGARLEVRQ